MPLAAAAAQTFREAPGDPPEVASRAMFGWPCAFAHGQLFCSLQSGDFAPRRADEGRAAFIAATGSAIFEAPPGRAMREYAVVPPDLARPPEALVPWIAKALAPVRTLPPKEPKASKRKGAA